jgi:hypothetical protein
MVRGGRFLVQYLQNPARLQPNRFHRGFVNLAVYHRRIAVDGLQRSSLGRIVDRDGVHFMANFVVISDD